jgi:16S rRNA (guanine966-N2)-methyltransferase
MRIISGQRRGHKIDGPRAATGTRPTSDLVRESMFNILRELVVDRVVIDLFAGTGALGLEALSRGAREAIFVERDRENVALIYRNIATLRYQDRTTVRHADAYRWVRSYAPSGEDPVVVFLDPPYREYEIHSKYVNRMLSGLVEWLPRRSAIVLESGRSLDERILPDLESWDIRRYGSTRVALRLIPDEDAGLGGGAACRESSDTEISADPDGQAGEAVDE